jgi:hypothetical protein
VKRAKSAFATFSPKVGGRTGGFERATHIANINHLRQPKRKSGCFLPAFEVIFPLKVRKQLFFRREMLQRGLPSVSFFAKKKGL